MPALAEIAGFGENLRADTRTGGYRFFTGYQHPAPSYLRSGWKPRKGQNSISYGPLFVSLL